MKVVQKDRRAFTLIELLVVITIIVILAAILFPVFARARENARRASCQSNLKQIALGIFMYNQDYDEKLPFVQGASPNPNRNPYGWADALEPYLKSTQIFQCPSDPIGPTTDPTLTGETNTAGYTDYWMNANVFYLSDAALLYPSETLLLGDGGGGNNGNKFQAAGFNTLGGYIASGEYSTAGYGRTGSGSYVSWGWIPGSGSNIHLGGCNFAFADGHVKWLTGSKVVSGQGVFTDAVKGANVTHANAGGKPMFWYN